MTLTPTDLQGTQWISRQTIGNYLDAERIYLLSDHWVGIEKLLINSHLIVEHPQVASRPHLGATIKSLLLSRVATIRWCLRVAEWTEQQPGPGASSAASLSDLAACVPSNRSSVRPSSHVVAPVVFAFFSPPPPRTLSLSADWVPATKYAFNIINY